LEKLQIAVRFGDPGADQMGDTAQNQDGSGIRRATQAMARDSQSATTGRQCVSSLRDRRR
jgi:hypothetical protein